MIGRSDALSFDALPPVTAGFDTHGNWHIPGGPEGGRFAKPGWSGAKAAAVHAVRGLLAREAARDAPDGALLRLRDDAPPSLHARLHAQHGPLRAVWHDARHARVDVDGRRVLVPWGHFADPATATAQSNDMPARPFTPAAALDDVYDPVAIARHLFAGTTDTIEYRLGEVKGRPDGSRVSGWTYAHDRETGDRVGEFQWRLGKLDSEIEWVHAWIDPKARRQAVATSLISHADRAAADRLGIRQVVIGASDAGTVAWASPEFGLRFDPDGRGDFVRGALARSERPELRALAARFDGPPETWPTPSEIRAMPGGTKVLHDAGNWVGVADLHPAQSNDMPDRPWFPQWLDTMAADAAESPPYRQIKAKERIEHAARLFDHDLGDGYGAKVTKATSHNFEGVFTDPGGGEIGTFDGSYSRRDDGRTVINLGLVRTFNPGHGQGTRWLAAVEAAARDAGVDEIRFDATSTADNRAIGAYVWARAGYDWGWTDHAAFNRQIADKILAVDPGNEVGQRLRDADTGPSVVGQGSGKPWPTPAEVAADPVGKQVLLGKYGRAVWPAKKQLHPPAQSNDMIDRETLAERFLSPGPGFARDLAALYEMDLDDHVYTQADSALGRDGNWQVRGEVIDRRTGNEVGEFHRTFRVDDGDVIVSHESFSLDPGEVSPSGRRTRRSYQGRGYGSKFTRTVEARYRAEGFTAIETHAVSDSRGTYDAGVYTWANAGFDWKLDSRHGVKLFLRSATPIVEDLSAVPYPPPDDLDPDVVDAVRSRAAAVAERLDDLIRRVEEGDTTLRPDDVTPYDIASLGAAEGWPVGKYAMTPDRNTAMFGATLDFLYRKPLDRPTRQVNDLVERPDARRPDTPAVRPVSDRLVDSTEAASPPGSRPPGPLTASGPAFDRYLDDYRAGRLWPDPWPAAAARSSLWSNDITRGVHQAYGGFLDQSRSTRGFHYLAAAEFDRPTGLVDAVPGADPDRDIAAAVDEFYGAGTDATLAATGLTAPQFPTVGSDDARRFLRSLYDSTQAMLAEEGYRPDDRVVLWRGLSGPQYRAWRAAGRPDRLDTTPVASFAHIRDQAAKYGEREAGGTVAVEVAVRDVLAVGAVNHDYETIVLSPGDGEGIRVVGYTEPDLNGFYDRWPTREAFLADNPGPDGGTSVFGDRLSTDPTRVRIRSSSTPVHSAIDWAANHDRPVPGEVTVDLPTDAAQRDVWAAAARAVADRVYPRPSPDDPIPGQSNDLAVRPGASLVEYTTPAVVRWAEKLTGDYADLFAGHTPELDIVDGVPKLAAALDAWRQAPTPSNAADLWDALTGQIPSRRWIEDALVDVEPDPDAVETLRQAHLAAVDELGGPHEFVRRAATRDPFAPNFFGVNLDDPSRLDSTLRSWARLDDRQFRSLDGAGQAWGDVGHAVTFTPDQVLANVGDLHDYGEYLIPSDPDAIPRLMAGEFPAVAAARPVGEVFRDANSAGDRAPDVAAEVVKRAARAAPFRDRLTDMLRHVERGGSGYSSNAQQSRLRLVRVASKWPVSGSVIVERLNDGSVWRLQGPSGRSGKWTVKRDPAPQVNDMPVRPPKPGVEILHPQHYEVVAALEALDDDTLLYVRDHTDVPELAGRAAAVYARRYPASQANDMADRPDGLTGDAFDVVDQGLSPLRYHRAATVRRLGATNDTVAHPERSHRYRNIDQVADQDYWSPAVEVNVGANGHRLKTPKRMVNPSAPQPGTAAFLDWHPVGPDRVYLDYVNVHPDYQGLGLASKLVDRLAADHPDATLDFGRVMSPSVWSIVERLRHEGRAVDARPDFGKLPPPRYAPPSTPALDATVARLEALDAAATATADRAVADLLGPDYTLDDVRRLLRRGGLTDAQRAELRRLRDSMTGGQVP